MFGIVRYSILEIIWGNLDMTRPKTILLVEDNIQDEELTVRAFRKNRLMSEILIARDGEEALNLLFISNVTPQLVLLDLNLPKVDGLEVLRRLRSDERTRLIPVVFLTSSTEEHDLTEGYNLGANSYVRKPVDYKQFSEAVLTLGSYWLTLNEPPPFQLKRS
jgi:two-component system response regulator